MSRPLSASAPASTGNSTMPPSDVASPEYARFAEWAVVHQAWVDNLRELQRHRWGFSFVASAAREARKDTAVQNKITYTKRYLEAVRDAASRRDDAEQAAYQRKWLSYEQGRKAYLTIGKAFHDVIAAPTVDVQTKRALMVSSERDGHLFHNAAVLWLEIGAQHGLPLTMSPALDYENQLKLLWSAELHAAHGWSTDRPVARQKAMVSYLFGRFPFVAMDRAAAQRADRGHCTVGKIIRHGRLEDPALAAATRLLPAYWGLFLFSPLHDRDRGIYEFVARDPDDSWVTRLRTPQHPIWKAPTTPPWPPAHIHPPPAAASRVIGAGAPAGGPPAPPAQPVAGAPAAHHRAAAPTVSRSAFQVHERLPRAFADPSTPPGLYLHRSSGHGRDEFLVLVTGTRPAVTACLKGVGGDPGLIGAETARLSGPADRLARRFTPTGNPQRLLPFEYADPARPDEVRGGSWRNLGFCTNFGGDEIASVDFDHFAALYQRSRLKPAYGADGFVAPYAVVELTSLIKGQLSATVTNAIKSGQIGYPVEVVTLSQRETSLRLERGGAQRYDYDCLPLEVLEWWRVVEPPATAPQGSLRRLIEAELVGLKGKFRGTDGIRAYELHARRCILAGELAKRILAHWLVFLDLGWASDVYTGSFSGRNFNTGPRDSNDWGPLHWPSEDGPGKPSGKGDWQLHVDLDDLGNTFGPAGYLLTALCLTPEQGNDFGGVDEAVAARPSQLPAESVLLKLCTAVQTFLNAVKNDPDLVREVATQTTVATESAALTQGALVLRVVRKQAKTHLPAKLVGLDVLALFNQLPAQPTPPDPVVP